MYVREVELIHHYLHEVIEEVPLLCTIDQTGKLLICDIEPDDEASECYKFHISPADDRVTAWASSLFTNLVLLSFSATLIS